ncbi:MAG: PCRF domain-containing protein [Candidatus Staskawiczbacteria bacterium]|jgi:peptide chain release factor 1
MQEQLPKKDIDAIIVEIRAGTGGDEAGLFARDLFRMYSKFGQSKGWGQKILDSNQSDLGGYKEIIFELNGAGIYDDMKNEAGVHRVQRIPKTEKSGRVHTSTITVAILPKPKKTEFIINPSDLKITTFKASGPGGQYVNKTESAIRIVHIPTGLVVTSQSERNQMQNKESALSILSAKLLERKIAEEQSQISGARNEQIGWAKRAEKMRTYNFPQDRITDHRIGKSWHDIEGIMDGRMDGIIKAFRKLEQEQPK